MDSFHISNIKLEKANAIKKHRQIQKIATFFRFIEICLVLALVSRFSVKLPVAVKNSGEYFKDLTVFLVSPRFIFILGNAIVVILFVKSGHFSGQDSNGENSRTDFYEEFVQNSEKSQVMHRYEDENRGKKQRTYVQQIVPEKTCASLEIKNYQRSQSEKLEQASRNKSCRELRRIASENCREIVDSSEVWMKIPYPEDNMSNEEFRSAVEDFIARQKRIRRDEENSV
ncbi:uncharacterized protein LOC126679975 [Mercurialis annua]|uniref:uncharacterized protein LOC126679975 n=1 Tax=Mercurialis annua TaxID=3986 RepID=UPI00215E111D|nr:uncharacterized protein LOC126679975 [Mercurialis annua]